jgi:hypothetical protein
MSTGMGSSSFSLMMAPDSGLLLPMLMLVSGRLLMRDSRSFLRSRASFSAF